MDKDLLKKHIKSFLNTSQKSSHLNEDYKERLDFVEFYKNYTEDKILQMSEEDIYEYIAPLWAMLIWGNKHYVIDKIIEDNGLENFKKQLAVLVWGSDDIEKRWDEFRSNIKGMGPAMMSEILCKTHPTQYMIWNRRVYVGLNYLQVDNLPRYDYQMTGKVYKHICNVSQDISSQLEQEGFQDSTLLAVDYFIWKELQVEETSDTVGKQDDTSLIDTTEKAEFKHNDVRDKLRDIGQWLGFEAKIEQKVADGSKVDTIWEATIGNMGRVIYVFEVQTKGSIDSLIINLLKSLNNPAVQGVVAVSEKDQIDKIKSHASGVRDLGDKLKVWDYEEVLKVHESLEFVNANINNLGLVPQGF